MAQLPDIIFESSIFSKGVLLIDRSSNIQFQYSKNVDINWYLNLGPITLKACTDLPRLQFALGKILYFNFLFVSHLNPNL